MLAFISLFTKSLLICKFYQPQKKRIFCFDSQYTSGWHILITIGDVTVSFAILRHSLFAYNYILYL